MPGLFEQTLSPEKPARLALDADVSQGPLY